MKIRKGFVSNSSSSSFVVIGYLVNSDKYSFEKLLEIFYPKEYAVMRKKLESKERGCEHPEADKEFCAECGKPMWIKDECEIDDYLFELQNDIENSDGISFYDSDHNDGCNSISSDQVLVGVMASSIYDSDSQLSPISDAMTKIKGIIEKIEVSDKNIFLYHGVGRE